MVIIIVIFVMIAIPITLAIAILFDSKRRIGKRCWGWAIAAFILFIIGPRYISPSSLDLASIASILGQILGAWLGIFILYRIFTWKAAKNYKEKKTSGD